MKRLIVLTVLGLAGCGGPRAPLTPEQVALVNAHMDRQTAITAAQMAVFSNATFRPVPYRGW